MSYEWYMGYDTIYVLYVTKFLYGYKVFRRKFKTSKTYIKKCLCISTLSKLKFYK